MKKDRWSVWLIDVSVSNNVSTGRDKRGSLISLVAAGSLYRGLFLCLRG